MSDTSVTVEKLPNCDFRHESETLAAYDGRTIGGSWAYMCQQHFERYGIGLGLGKGQKLILASEKE